MQQRGDGHNPQSLPFIDDMNISAMADKLLKSEKPEEFITALNFPDRRKAMAWSRSIHKCRRHKLVEGEKLFWIMAMSECAISETRAKLFSMTAMGVAVPGFYAKGAEQTEKAK